MKLWIKTAVLTSTCLLLFFAYQLHKINSRVYTPAPEYLAPLTIPKPLVRQETEKEKLLAGLPGSRQCFRQVFFEVMHLCGVQQNRFGNWLAIFNDGSGQLIKLSSGQSHDGVKIVSVDEKGCDVQYGSIERRFELP